MRRTCHGPLSAASKKLERATRSVRWRFHSFKPQVTVISDARPVSKRLGWLWVSGICRRRGVGFGVASYDLRSFIRAAEQVSADIFPSEEISTDTLYFGKNGVGGSKQGMMILLTRGKKCLRSV